MISGVMAGTPTGGADWSSRQRQERFRENRSAALRECLLGRRAAGGDLLARALTASLAAPTVEKVSLLATLGLLAMVGEKPPSADQVDLVARAITDGDTLAVAGLHAVHAQRAVFAAETTTARTWACASATAVDRLSDAELATCLEIVPLLAWVEACLGCRYDAERHCDRGAALAVPTGRTVLPPFLLLGRGLAWLPTAMGQRPRPTTPHRPADGPAHPLLASLTGREREIAYVAGTGRKNKEIADELNLSPRTVELHLTRIYRKLGIPSRAALARLMSQLGDVTAEREVTAERDADGV
ncbi:helix-turn-helix transcriptional regulator [Protofrankia coriariae]|uniref:HTH luxR-type domain-containing protein n=1 Tax=Protofrankia coriariae TaxID=1562887 RepID=A0ABR5F3L5_9ACTN|nr:helix-turn-helix transcriptional regulator [Protofrankia coriariae]KLL11319.1 hypothetical protein FrCorBMG51_11880 [Protofrankia coriariae]